MHFIVQKCFHLVYFYLFIFLAFGTSHVLKYISDADTMECITCVWFCLSHLYLLILLSFWWVVCVCMKLKWIACHFPVFPGLLQEIFLNSYMDTVPLSAYICVFLTWILFHWPVYLFPYHSQVALYHKAGASVFLFPQDCCSYYWSFVTPYRL